jgi:hypothetical protein
MDVSHIPALLQSPSISVFDAAIIEAGFDNYLTKLDRLESNLQAIAADDYIEVITKAKNQKGLIKSFLRPDYISLMQRHPTYHCTPARCADNNSDYLIHTIKPSDDCVIICHAGYVKVKIPRLSHLDDSRYRLILQAIANTDVFSHNQRVSFEPRNKIESMRQVLKRHFTIHRYECMFTFNDELSVILEPVFSRSAEQSIGQCHYLKNNPKKQKVLFTSKAYNITAYQDGKRDTFLPGDRVKIEFTWWPQFFNSRGLSIKDLTTPEKIFALFSPEHERLLRRFIWANLYPQERREVCRITGCDDEAAFMKKITDLKSLQVSVNRERLELENQAAQLNYAISKVIEHDNRIAAVEADNAAMKAQIAALTAALHELQNSPAISGSTDDQRKLRHLRAVK